MGNVKTMRVQSELELLSMQLQDLGRADLLQHVKNIMNDLSSRSAVEKPSDILTTGEAAKMLGVRSITTIKRWAAEGLLDGFRRGRRIVVSKESVERMLNTPTVAEQKRHEKEIEEAMAPFAGEEEDIPEPTPWIGRKPWAHENEPHV